MRTALSTIERALQTQLLLAFALRKGPAGRNTPYADPAALRGVPQANLNDDDVAFVTSKGVTYQFSRTDTRADDGDVVLKPTDGGTAGRWIKTASTVASGYALLVRVHVGEDS